MGKSQAQALFYKYVDFTYVAPELMTKKTL